VYRARKMADIYLTIRQPTLREGRAVTCDRARGLKPTAGITRSLRDQCSGGNGANGDPRRNYVLGTGGTGRLASLNRSATKLGASDRAFHSSATAAERSARSSSR